MIGLSVDLKSNFSTILRTTELEGMADLDDKIPITVLKL